MELEDINGKVIKHMRKLRDSDNQLEILRILKVVKSKFYLLHVSTLFAVVSMTHNLDNPEIIVLSGELNNKIKVLLYPEN